MRTAFSVICALAAGICVIGAGAGVSGCAAKSSAGKAVVTDCVLPEDQTGTLAAQWKATPVPLAIKSGSFNDSETAAIKQAADTWNEFFQTTRGAPIFDYGGGSFRQSSAAKPQSVCSQGIINGTSFSGSVVIYKSGTWPYSNKDAIALTSFCPSPAKPLPKIYMGIIEVNYQHFFLSGKKQPDMTSIFVHELGHLMGLDHSCASGTKAGFPNCSSGSLNPEYFNAVMYPVILFDSLGFGEKRQTTQSNDQGRANCLYE